MKCLLQTIPEARRQKRIRLSKVSQSLQQAWRQELFSVVYLPFECCSEVACCVSLTSLLTGDIPQNTREPDTGPGTFPKQGSNSLVGARWLHMKILSAASALRSVWGLGSRPRAPGRGFSSELLAWVGPAHFQGACPPGSAPGPGCCLKPQPCTYSACRLA